MSDQGISTAWPPFALLAALAAIVLIPAFLLTPRVFEDDLGTPFAQREADWTSSNTCASCHPDQHASWYRTFHRTMTQEATPASVRGAFDGREMSYQGVSARAITKDGRYFLEYAGPPLQRFEILRTVGSRRYQQYLAKIPDGGENYYRLPLLWHIEDERWMHLNGAFLGPDGQDYNTHLTTWNQNCIFCHNTGPEPGLTNWLEMNERQARGERVDSSRESRYRSTVAELGIACESCHGPGEEHARRNRNPFRRYLLHLGGRDDPTIVNPAKLPQQESADLCGQCHGQRTFGGQETLRTTLEEGPSFRAGERLAEHVETVWRETRLPVRGQEDLFERRFWADGTARLTAYEYQGLLQSPCFQAGELTCISCHSMHDGDPRGQLTEAMRGPEACLSCHADIGADIPSHTLHEADSSGASCTACHMPKMVYGIMEIHRSHRIENPDPARNAATARPDACTSCHLDRSLDWAAKEVAEGWGRGDGRLAGRRDGAPLEAVDSVASLLAGDPVQRAVAARLAGRVDSPLAPTERAFLIPHLITAMGDPYPAVRRFAHRSLLAITADLRTAGMDLDLGPGLTHFDFLAPQAERQGQLRDLARRWAGSEKAAFPAPPEGSFLGPGQQPLVAMIGELQRLGRLRSKEIHIGE